MMVSKVLDLKKCLEYLMRKTRDQKLEEMEIILVERLGKYKT